MQYIPCLYNKVIVCPSVCVCVCMYNILYNTDASNEKGPKQQNMLQSWKEFYFFRGSDKRDGTIWKVRYSVLKLILCQMGVRKLNIQFQKHTCH